MAEAPDNTPNLAHERYLKKQRRINELQEKLQEQVADHFDDLDERNLTGSQELLLTSVSVEDITRKREQIWKTAGELLRLDEAARPPIVPVKPEE